NNPPEKIRKLSQKKQRQWVSVFNSCYESGGDDAKCHAQAWGVVGKRASMEDMVVMLERLVFGCDCQEEDDEVAYLDVGVNPKNSEGCGCDAVGDCGCEQTHSALPSVIAERIMGNIVRRASQRMSHVKER